MTGVSTSGWGLHRALQVVLYTHLVDQAQLRFQSVNRLFFGFEYALNRRANLGVSNSVTEAYIQGANPYRLAED